MTGVQNQLSARIVSNARFHLLTFSHQLPNVPYTLARAFFLLSRLTPLFFIFTAFPFQFIPPFPHSRTDSLTTHHARTSMAAVQPTAPPPLPVRTHPLPPPHAAGGGTPSSAMRKTPLESFSPAVMSHLKSTFEALTAADPHLDAFFRTTQGEAAAPPPRESPRPPRTLPDFLGYMASPASAAMGPPRGRDMSYPISNYFISTSHNTYLSGNQLYGEASTLAYKNVLVRGCRCLEIDVWNGDEDAGEDGEHGTTTKEEEKLNSRLGRFAGKVKDLDSKAHLHNPLHHSNTDGEAAPAPGPSHVTQPATDQMPAPWRSTPPPARVEPRVLHGHTLTREVSFRSVCETIRDNAFVASTLPIIVSLEVHANLQQQEIMVEIMRSTWTGLLVDVDAAQEEKISHLPSPDELRNKILIKVKWSPDPDSKTGESTDPRDHVAADVSEDEDENKFAPPPTSSGEPVKKAKKASKILHDLSKLGIYTRAYSFKTFSSPEASLPNHVFSLSEVKVLDFCEEGGLHASAVFNHNRNFLMRVFPSGLRVNSSNVEPTFLWRQGAQMVALNWQKWDLGMMLNEGMFAGEEGWVLKPEGYRGTISSVKGDAQAENKDIRRKNLDLTIELLAGQDLPLPTEKVNTSRFHPYVKMQLHGDNRTPESEGTKMTSKEDRSDTDDSDFFKRRSKTSKTADPDFGGEKLHWSKLSGVIEELSFLR